MTDLDILFLQKSREGDLLAVIHCLDQGADIHTGEEKALQSAAQAGHLGIVQLLLDRGADIHAREEYAFMLAAKHGHTEVVQLLLDRGAHNMRYAFGECPLNHAAYYGHLKVVQLLLDRREITRYAMESALRYCADAGHLDVVRLLLDRGADVHAYGDFALLISAEFRHLEVVRLLLDRGADIHARGDSALRLAAENGHLEVVQFLLDRGADIHFGEDRALCLAAEKGHLEVVRLLLDQGADVHARGEYALRYAAENGYLEIVRLLLDRGANPRNILAKKMDKIIKRTIISHSRHRLKIDQETLISFLDDPPLFHASMTLRYLLLSAVKAYLYSPWSRSNTENLELLRLEEDEESNRRSLRRHRDTLISQVVDNPRWTHDYLLHNFSSVPWGDDSPGLRSLIGDGNPRPSRRQLICRLPTSILEELTS